MRLSKISYLRLGGGSAEILILRVDFVRGLNLELATFAGIKMHASNLAIAERLSVWRFDLFDLNIESRAFWQGRERHPAILQ